MLLTWEKCWAVELWSVCFFKERSRVKPDPPDSLPQRWDSWFHQTESEFCYPISLSSYVFWDEAEGKGGRNFKIKLKNVVAEIAVTPNGPDSMEGKLSLPKLSLHSLIAVFVLGQVSLCRSAVYLSHSVHSQCSSLGMIPLTIQTLPVTRPNYFTTVQLV